MSTSPSSVVVNPLPPVLIATTWYPPGSMFSRTNWPLTSVIVLCVLNSVPRLVEIIQPSTGSPCLSNTSPAMLPPRRRCRSTSTWTAPGTRSCSTGSLFTKPSATAARTWVPGGTWIENRPSASLSAPGSSSSASICFCHAGLSLSSWTVAAATGWPAGSSTVPSTVAVRTTRTRKSGLADIGRSTSMRSAVITPSPRTRISHVPSFRSWKAKAPVSSSTTLCTRSRRSVIKSPCEMRATAIV